MQRQAAQQFGVLRHAVHVRLEESKACFECGELLEEPFLGGFLFPAIVAVFISSVDCLFHDILVAEKAHGAPSR